MDREYQPLPIRELGAHAGFRRPLAPTAPPVSPATIGPQAPLAVANQFMITRSVWLLVVTDEQENVLGVITATDLLSERPMRVAIDRGLRRDELTVGDIMVSAEQAEVIDHAEVAGARVGHVFETLRPAGRQHALVVDFDEQPGADVARTFAEIETAIK
jgi:hypothetical protein